MPGELTERQQQILNIYAQYYEQHGVYPTVRELGALAGISSTCTTKKHLEALRQKGYITEAHGKARAGVVINTGNRPNPQALERFARRYVATMRRPHGYLYALWESGVLPGQTFPEAVTAAKAAPLPRSETIELYRDALGALGE